MKPFSGLETIVETNVPLAKYTWYGLGGNADFFVRPNSVEQLQDVVKRCVENDIKMRVMGYGSNLLVGDGGVRGAVVKFESDAFTKIEFDDAKVIAGGGAPLREVVLTSVERGLAGLEALAGIPGSVGGAVRMNAGGQFGDFGSVVESVTLMDKTGAVFQKSKPELVFDYRSTNITAKFVLGAELNLQQGDREQIMKTMQEVWVYKKNSQPLNTKNSGCIFKNPRGMSAGAIIDRAGLKGERVGGAMVSDKHANFIVADSDCKSSDVIALIEKVQKTVAEKFGTELEREIEIWD